MDAYRHSPRIENQRRYLSVAFTCSVVPIIAVVVLPEPLRSSLLPIAALFLGQTFLYGLALLLVALERLWQMFRRPSADPIRCPSCYSVEQPYRLFFVRRVAPHLLRVQCPECYERWIERA